jgi:hypothetical protein
MRTKRRKRPLLYALSFLVVSYGAYHFLDSPSDPQIRPERLTMLDESLLREPVDTSDENVSNDLSRFIAAPPAECSDYGRGGSLFGCENTCGPKGAKRNPEVKRVELRPALRAASPGSVESAQDALASAELLQNITDVLSIGAGAVKGSAELTQAIATTLGSNAVNGPVMDQIKKGLDKVAEARPGEGVAIWVQIGWDECGEESCCVVLSRLNWQPKTGWYKYSDDNAGLDFGVVGGFANTDAAGIASAIPQAISEAINALAQ